MFRNLYGRKTVRTIIKYPPTAHQWIQAFFQFLQQIDVTHNTVIGYQKDLSRFLAFYQQNYPRQKTFAQLQPSDVVHFRQTMLHEHKLAPATVNRHLNALRRFCRFCHDQGWLKNNPAAVVKFMRLPKQTQPRGLQTRETYALLQAAADKQQRLGTRNQAIIQLFLQTGVRVSEVASLLVGDLVIYDRSGHVRVRDGTGHRERTVPLNTTARRALRLYLETRQDVHTHVPAFVGEQGGPLSIRGLQRVVKQLLRQAGLERAGVSVHTLRHTFALTYLRNNPGKLLELAQLLGHESIDTTAVYACPSQEDMAADLERSMFNTDKDLVGT